MTTIVKTNCNNCGKNCTAGKTLYGPLHVSIKAEVEPAEDADLDFCSYHCLAIWAAEKFD